jgi:hypothetical protein
MGRVGRTETLELSRKLLRWLKAHPDTNGRIATLGYGASAADARSAPRPWCLTMRRLSAMAESIIKQLNCGI